MRAVFAVSLRKKPNSIVLKEIARLLEGVLCARTDRAF
jgi:hypothetical protein